MAASRQDETEESPSAENSAESGVSLEGGHEEGHAAQVAQLEARLRSVSAAYKDKQAEVVSIKDRLNRQAQVQEEIRRGEVVQTLFEPVENLLRSVDAARGLPVEAGLRMVHAQFLDALRKLGLEEVPGVGTRFDPSLHEAIASQPVPEAAQDNIVLSVFSAGYRIGTRLVRPARVIIGSYTGSHEEA